MKRKLFAYGLAMAMTLSSVASVWAGGAAPTENGVSEGAAASSTFGTRQTVTGGTGGGDSTVTDVVKVTLPSTAGDADFVIDPKGFYGAKKAVALEEDKITNAATKAAVISSSTGASVTWADLKGVKLSEITAGADLGNNSVADADEATGIQNAIKAMGSFDPATDTNHIFGVVDQVALDKFKGKVVGKKAMNVKNEGTDNVTVSATFIPKAEFEEDIDEAKFLAASGTVEEAPTDADGKHNLMLKASINANKVYSGLKISSIQGIKEADAKYYSPDYEQTSGAHKGDVADADKAGLIVRGDDDQFIKFDPAEETVFTDAGQTIKVMLDGDPTYSLASASATAVTAGNLATKNYKEKYWDAAASTPATSTNAAVVDNVKIDDAADKVKEPCTTAFYIGGTANTKADWSAYSGANPTASITMNVVYAFDKNDATADGVAAGKDDSGFIRAGAPTEASVAPVKATYKGDDPDVERATGEDVVFKIKNNESIAKMFAFKPDDRERTESAGTLVFGGVDLGGSVDYSSYYSLNADGTELTIFAKGFKEGLFQANGGADNTYKLEVKVGTEFDSATAVPATVVRKFEK